MSEYTEFYLKSKASVVQLDCFEFSHPNFTQTYYIVRNSTLAITVTHEDVTEHEYLCYPMRIVYDTLRDDLDVAMTIQMGDLGEVIAKEIRAVKAADGFAIYPQVKYRAYRSDDLTSPLYGPALLEIADFNFTRQGAQFKAQAPTLNSNKTGEKYAIARFPMLAGLL